MEKERNYARLMLDALPDDATYGDTASALTALLLSMATSVCEQENTFVPLQQVRAAVNSGVDYAMDMLMEDKDAN